MKIQTTDYRGGQALLLTTAALELVVTTSVGPRIVSLRGRGAGAANLFYQFPEPEKRHLGYYLRGGHRLWHSPEHVVRTYQPDDEPVAVKPVRGGVALGQLPAARTVRVTHGLTNTGLWPVEAAPWALTMLRGGGHGVLPLPPKGSHAEGDLLPTYALVPWSYTDLSKPVWNQRRDFLGVDVGQAAEPHKLGITHYPGWSAYWLDGVTFVKHAAVVAGARYPDLGCCFELFTNGEMVEFETLGPLARIEPGESVTHVEHWTLIEDLPKPTDDRAFSSALAPAVARWLKTL
jgi:hypothetical protein